MNSSNLKSSVGVFGGSFDPPGNHHVEIVHRLTEIFSQVIVIPSGPRPDRSYLFADPELRIRLARAAFSGISGVELDLSDISKDSFTYTFDLEQRLRQSCSPVHVIGADLVIGGSASSPIVKSWYRGNDVWNNLQFLLLARPGFELREDERPPHSSVLTVSVKGSSTAIRDAYQNGEAIDQLVPSSVAEILVRGAH